MLLAWRMMLEKALYRKDSCKTASVEMTTAKSGRHDIRKICEDSS